MSTAKMISEFTPKTVNTMDGRIWLTVSYNESPGEFPNIVEYEGERYYKMSFNSDHREVTYAQAQGRPFDLRHLLEYHVSAKSLTETKPKYKTGDKVHWINRQGVYLGIRTILSHEDSQHGLYYFIDPIDTPWCSISEECLYPTWDVDLPH